MPPRPLREAESDILADTLCMIADRPIITAECWQLRYVLPATGLFACATLWRWPNGRTRLRLVSLGHVHETRRLQSFWEMAAFLGLRTEALRLPWRRLS